MVQSNVSLDAFRHFMEILDGTELQFCPETFDDLMLLAREFGHNSLITYLVPQRDFPRREGTVQELLQELNRSLRATTIEDKFQSIGDAFADVQRLLSMIQEKIDEKLETILPEPDNMTELVKQPSHDFR